MSIDDCCADSCGLDSFGRLLSSEEVERRLNRPIFITPEITKKFREYCPTFYKAYEFIKSL